MSEFGWVMVIGIPIALALGALIGAWLTGPRLDRDTDDWANHRGKYARRD